jgi:hypothetical protein
VKAKILSGATVAVAAMGLILAGAAPAAAKHHKHHRHHKKIEKHHCGGKNGCPAKTGDKGAAAPAQPMGETK